VGNGVVLYRGHGGRFSWSEWDFNDNSLTDADVVNVAISNSDPSPVVLSVSCANSRIDASNAPTISEWWLRRSRSSRVVCRCPRLRWWRFDSRACFLLRSCGS
jgi:hypothetical protein